MATFKTFNVFTVPLEEAHKRRATMIVGEGIENRDGTISIRFTSPLPFGFDGRLTLAERVEVAPSPSPSSPRPISQQRHVPGVKNSTGYIGDPPRCAAMLLADDLSCELEHGHEGDHRAKGKSWRECPPAIDLPKTHRLEGDAPLHRKAGTK